MIHEIELQNMATNKAIKFGNQGNYILDVVDWDAPATSIDSYKIPFQIGETFAGISIGVREPSIIGYIIANDVQPMGKTWEQYYKEQEQEIEQKKLQLDKLISVNQNIRINANGFYLDCRPTKPPKYSNSIVENNEVLCKFSLEFICLNPLFYSDTKCIELASVNSAFVFPFSMTQDKGVIFGNIEQKQVQLINNEGDVNCGLKVKIRALGGAIRNPKIYNVTTGQFIQFEDVTLNDGDILYVNTVLGEENSYIHRVETGEDESIIGNTTTGSEYFQIIQGSSFYAYSLEESSPTVEATIEYKELFFNVRGQ